jgi:FixJ family two-component response regulator
MPDMKLLQSPYALPESVHSIDLHEIQQAFLKSRTLEQLQKSAQIQIAQLTAREFEVLRRVTSGIPNKTTACQLQISAKTVEKYRGNVMRKLQVRTVPDLMRVWLQAFPQELRMTSAASANVTSTG